MKLTQSLKNVSQPGLSLNVRQTLFARCLNLEFDALLCQVKKLPLNQLEEAFLHLFLAKSVQHAHVPSVDFLWYRFVMGRKVLMVKPSMLCGVGAVALNGNKPFIPPQVCTHFENFFGEESGVDEYRNELLRIKVESFAKSTSCKVSFREKWKIFLEDIDNVVQPNCEIRVRDFPYLTQSLEHADRELLEQLLFHENKISIHNSSSLPLLLNMALLQPKLDADFKIRLFCEFRDTHKSLDYNDSISILFRVLRSDVYRSTKLMQYLTNNCLTVPPLGAKCFLDTTDAQI
ncbi:LANO_0F03444g1_1 [Lachancea nothofagi CBS 11611]|uniref:LANO_0F03444g1_1 n=1 Tax=Lachancea nothofagi CBS 11611 TaxID=1266666 RepID=A0A1G4K746_9SACH|nr:LANO_0F03444g1_1 [Lachancea nothofagi CBS 11611]